MMDEKGDRERTGPFKSQKSNFSGYRDLLICL